LSNERNDSETLPPSHNGNGPFYPYPNRNSFLIGEWYWNGSIQKSQESFNELLKIIGDPDFTSDDVRKTKWSEINSSLGANDFDDNPNQAEWLDADAGWQRTPISIRVPFHNRMKHPGPQEEEVVCLYHCSLVSIIREKLANSSDDANFHYEPYDLFWQPTEDSDKVRVHGELYASPAFCEAHRELQESAGEPGCDLPRVVVALMFSSDATHLTSFGNAKLWPLYLFFGNESKYRRCKPACNLCNHVAYFQNVSLPHVVALRTHDL
jgi:hypothetical protein